MGARSGWAIRPTPLRLGSKLPSLALLPHAEGESEKPAFHFAPTPLRPPHASTAPIR